LLAHLLNYRSDVMKSLTNSQALSGAMSAPCRPSSETDELDSITGLSAGLVAT